MPSTHTHNYIHNSYDFNISSDELTSNDNFEITDNDDWKNNRFNDGYYIHKFKNDNSNFNIEHNSERWIKVYDSSNTDDKEVDFQNELTTDCIKYQNYCTDLHTIKNNTDFSNINNSSSITGIVDSRNIFKDRKECVRPNTDKCPSAQFVGSEYESRNIKFIPDEIMDNSYTRIIFTNNNSPIEEETGWKGSKYTLNIKGIPDALGALPSEQTKLDCSVLIVGGGGGRGYKLWRWWWRRKCSIY